MSYPSRSQAGTTDGTGPASAASTPSQIRAVRAGVPRDHHGIRVPNPIDMLMSDFASFINSKVALLCQLDGEGRPNQVSAVGPRAVHLITRPHEGGFAGRALSLPRAALEPLDPVEDAALVHATRPKLTCASAAPVRLATRVAGALIAGYDAPPGDPSLALWATESYAALIGLAMQSPETVDRLLGPARCDGLTGCLTFGALLDELAREINRSARGGLGLSVCFVDLDGFKRVNDSLGHLRGNQVLAEVARILRGGVRSFDSVGRYGGDEFIAILPQTDQPSAVQLAQRLRGLIVGAGIDSPDGPLTASIGVAAWVPGASVEELLGAADAALLMAKSTRAGVIAANSQPPPGSHDPRIH